MFTVKTYKDSLKLKKGNDFVSQQLYLFAVKGEKISFQFTVSTDADISLDDYSLTCDNTQKLLCELFAQEYLTFDKPSNEFLQSGTYPDAIIPFEHAKANGYNIITANDERSFLVRLTIPFDYSVGEFSYVLNIVLSGTLYEISFMLKIYDITLPEQNNCKAMFSIFKDGDWLTGTTEQKYQEYKEIYEMLADYRVSGTYLPTKSIEIDNAKIKDVIEAAKLYANDKRIACYSLNYKVKKDILDGREFSVIDREYFKALLVALVENSTNECNLLNNCVLYLATITDEPAPDRFPQVRRAYKDVYEIKREVANQLDFTNKREVEKSLLTCDNIITVFQKEPIYGEVDTWCPTFWGYSHPEYRYEAKQLAHLGFKHWFYGCMSPQNPFPTYEIDNNLHQVKVVNYLMFDYDIIGNLFWAVNLSYSKTDSVYNNPLDGHEILPDFHGDGYLVYNKACYGKLVPSLRLNAVMEGNQDYERLLIYRSSVENLADMYNVSIDCKSILRPYLDKIYDGAAVSENATYLTNIEQVINELIELANSGVAFEKTCVKDNIAYLTVYSSSGIDASARLVDFKKHNGFDVSVYAVAINKDKNFFDFIVGGKNYSLFIGDKVNVIPLNKLQTVGNKVSLSPYNDGVLVKTLSFLNSEKETTEFIYKCNFDASNLDRLYFEIDSLCDFECVLSADLISADGSAFELGYDMIEQKSHNLFSFKKQMKVIKRLNDYSGMLEGYHKSKYYIDRYNNFDFTKVTAIRFNVLNNTKLLDDNRERRTPNYKFVIKSIYYSENDEKDI